VASFVIAAATSALLAVVFGEPEAERFRATLRADTVAVSAVSLAEALIVAEARQGADARRDLELLVAGAVDRTVAIDDLQARAAAAAWRVQGRSLRADRPARRLNSRVPA
jgi:ribonuclease VapC